MDGFIHCVDCVFNVNNACHFNPPKAFIVAQKNALGETLPHAIGVLPSVQPGGFCNFGLPRPILAE